VLDPRSGGLAGEMREALLTGLTVVSVREPACEPRPVRMVATPCVRVETHL